MTQDPRDPATLARVITSGLADVAPWSGRSLIALAGPPASGKSTLSLALVDALNSDGVSAALVPMDGFHLDNQVLQPRGLLARKGAPETFDLQGFVHALTRLRTGEEVVLPSFDRDLDRAIAGSIVVSSDIDVVVVEGNYLAFDEPGWRDLMPFWRFSVRLRASRTLLEERLIQRWIDQGFDLAKAERKARENDIPNAFRIMDAELPTSMVLEV